MLKAAQALGAGWERGAVDRPAGQWPRLLDLLQHLKTGPGTRVYPLGLDGSALWEPWRRVRDEVELLPTEPQEPGARTDYLIHDPAAGLLTLGLLGPWTPGCPRFKARACPRMAPMGHESPHSDCNYWSWSGFAAAVPGLELFPEWQRYDCVRYYEAFQWHLCGEALAAELGARPRFVVHAPADFEPVLRGYAALTARPEAFILESGA